MESLRRLIQWFSLLRACMKETISLREKVVFLTEENQRLEKVADALRDELKQVLITVVTDPLTGVSNRVFLSQNVANIFSAHERAKSPIGLLTIDLDHFKDVNDIYGHEMGDKVLVQVAQIFRETVRSTDHVVRLGGDEFVIILTYVDSVEALETVANKLLKQIFEMRIEGCETVVTLSIGGLLNRIGLDKRMDLRPELAFRRADELLYVSKRRRNIATVFSS